MFGTGTPSSIPVFTFQVSQQIKNTIRVKLTLFDRTERHEIAFADGVRFTSDYRSVAPANEDRLASMQARGIV